jgi:cobalt-zinc-cadmium efflux system outer membrane protein
MDLRLPFLALALASGAARAQPREEIAYANTLLVSSPRLVAWLRARNAGVQAAVEKTHQAEAEARQAGVLPNPTLGLAWGGIPVGTTNPPGLSVGDSSQITIGLSEVIELGKRGPRTRAAELRAGAATEDGVATVADKLGDARLALAKAVYARARLTQQEENLRAARNLADLEQARRRAGDISQAELERVILEAQNVELDVVHGRADLADALAACRAVLEAPCAVDDVSPELLDRAAEVPGAVPPLEERADLRSLELQRRSAIEDATLARNRAIPDPEVGLAFTRDWFLTSGANPYTFTLSVGFPLPFLDTGSHDAAKAEAHARELAATTRGTLVEARADVAGLYEKKRHLEDGLRLVTTDSIARSQAVVEATRQAYNTGHVSLSDLILVERSHRELVGKALDLRFELFSARNELRRALGLDAQEARQP